MVVSVALAVVTLTGVASLTVVYALAAVGGLVLVFDSPGRQTLTFQMVGPSELPNAVALNSGLFNASRVVGPALAGIAIAAVGVGLCFVINAISFLAVLVALRVMREEELTPVAKSRDTRVLAGIREGVAWSVRSPLALTVLAVVTVVATVGFNFNVLVPLLASQTLHAGPGMFGVLSASFGLGALAGALMTATLGRASPRTFAAGALGFSLAMLALAPVRTPGIALVLLFALGLGFSLFTASANALVQLASPDHLRGRVVSLYLFAFVGLAPIGGLVSGWLADRGGTELAFTVAGLAGVAAVAWAYPRLRAAGRGAAPASG
jgi:MFS family permease